MLSVNTNTGAMLALQYLNKTDRELQVAQAHIPIDHLAARVMTRRIAPC